MKKSAFRWTVFGAVIGLLAWSAFVASCLRSPLEQVDLFLTAILTGLISGFFANRLHIQYNQEQDFRQFKDRLSDYAGEYEVYHWKDFQKPDDCQYRVAIMIDYRIGMFRLHQTGTKDEHEMLGEVRISKSTFSFGKGNYSHPKRVGQPNGTIELYLLTEGLINVDKYFLDDQDQKPGTEKWQWRKIVSK